MSNLNGDGGERDVNADLGVELVYELIRTFNERFHGEAGPPYGEAAEAEQAAAATAFIYVRDQPELSASELHDEWVRTMIEDGWVYGERADAEAQTHPFICEFAEVPAYGRRMLHFVVAAVHMLSAPIEMLDKAMEDEAR